jgi:hypothetical protein
MRSTTELRDQHISLREYAAILDRRQLSPNGNGCRTRFRRE